VWEIPELEPDSEWLLERQGGRIWDPCGRGDGETERNQAPAGPSEIRRDEGNSGELAGATLSMRVLYTKDK